MKKLVFALLVLAHSTFALAEGLVTKSSTHSVLETVDKLEQIVKSKGFKVVARVNHAGAAKANGLTLRPTEVLIFGNPKVGSKLMSSQQAIGLDLPVKVVVWEEENGEVKLAYNDPTWMAQRYGITDRSKVINKMTGALAKFTDAAAN